MANKGLYKVNDGPCLMGSQGHIWSKTENALVSLCLICYQPKIVVK